jgi:hypothetical protein
LPAFEEGEVLDHLNGVPALDVFGKPGDKFLFWRASGLLATTEERASAWRGQLSRL